MTINLAFWFLLAIAMLLCEAAGLFAVPGLVWFLWWLHLILLAMVFAVIAGVAMAKLRY